jgi:hypothetical protein
MRFARRIGSALYNWPMETIPFSSRFLAIIPLYWEMAFLRSISNSLLLLAALPTSGSAGIPPTMYPPPLLATKYVILKASARLQCTGPACWDGSGRATLNVFGWQL